MTLRWRCGAVAVLGVALLAGCTSGSSRAPGSSGPTSRHPGTTALVSTSPPKPADPAAPCTAGNMRASLVGGGPAMGHVSLVIRLVNRGRFPCREHGWPRLVARSSHGPTTAEHVRDDPMLTDGTVRRLPATELAPGRAAYLIAAGSDVAFDPSGAARSCPGAYHTFRITLPGDDRVLVVKPRFEPTLATFRGFPSCGGVSVTPVVPSAAVVEKLREASGHRPLPRCHSGQLHARYRAGPFSAGHDYGYLRLVNDSSPTCQLSGTVTVRPIDGRGKPVRLTGNPNATVALRAVQFLAHGSTHRTAAIMVGASVRTADGRDACPIKQRVSPTAWRLTGAINATVANTDPAVQPYERGRVRHLYGCAGTRGIDLLDASLGTR
jgi:uncharacterized protein DUF4232